MQQVQPNVFKTENPGWGGLNVEDLEFKMGATQSPDMLNLRVRNGMLGKRLGQQWYSAELGTIYAMFRFHEMLYIHAGAYFYKQTDYNGELYTFTQIGSCSEQKGQFFAFNNHLYYINGIDYKVFDDTFKDVEPYVPNIVINRIPSGESGDLADNYNRLGSGFKNTFSADGESKEYVLTDKDLDDTEVIVVVDGVTKTLTTDYTVDRTTGKVTFVTAPSKGTNNVEITAYKTEQEYIDSIRKCKFAISYGGENNSRIFIGGSGANYYFSGVLDPTYFPENNYSPVGNNSGDITGFGEQYDTLIVFTERETYAVEYYTDDDGLGRFTQTLVNAKVGCDCPNTIQLVQNRLVWLTTYGGVYTMVSTAIEDERNIMPISRNINKKLLREPNLKQSVSVDFQENYMVCVNDHVYTWNYGITPYSFSGNVQQDAYVLAWFYYNNINANCFVGIDDKLLYGRENRIVEFTEDRKDFDYPIESYYYTPAYDFDSIDYLKTAQKMFVSVRGDVSTRLDMTYYYDSSVKEEDEPIIMPARLWSDFSLINFSLEGAVKYAKTYMKKIKIKKFRNLSIKFYNNHLDMDMNLAELAIYYTYAKLDKGG